MQLDYLKITNDDVEELALWLAGDSWPFHGYSRPDPEKIRQSFAEGYYTGPEVETYWILGHQEKLGMIRIFDLEDPTPMFDLRVRSQSRGMGIGSAALRWLTDHVFNSFPDKIRIEGHTRCDNIGMRRTFLKCGYVLEARHRSCWRSENGRFLDSVGYGITRHDWETGTITPVEWDGE
ncbi:MAG: GNAT family protein [Candidatus Wallbacteria bacterium]|nr:GNAT family protein [Candidatus Wallbacteria bacterium]